MASIPVVAEIHGEQEKWAPVPGYESFYAAGDLGRLRSFDRNYQQASRTGKLYTHRKKGRILKIATTASHGYATVNLCNGQTQKIHLVHRLMAASFIPNPENNPEVNHKNGDRLDNRVDNLEWVTTSTNVLHSYRQLGHAKNDYRGERNPSAKLTSENIMAIERALTLGQTHKQIALQFGVHRSLIGLIANRKIWANA